MERCGALYLHTHARKATASIRPHATRCSLPLISTVKEEYVVLLFSIIRVCVSVSVGVCNGCVTILKK